MLTMRAPYFWGKFRVAKPFIFRKRKFGEDDIFNTRSLEPSRSRLHQLYREGFLEMLDPEEDLEYRMERQEAMDNQQPPQPKTEAVADEPEPEEEEDF